MNLIVRAKVFATAAHAAVGQRYGAGAPYIVHPADVVRILRAHGFGGDHEVMASGWLHDVVEDTAVTLDLIREQFGDEVARIVGAVTNEPGQNRRERHERTYPKTKAAGIKPIAVKLADRIANVRASLRDTRGGKFDMYLKEHAAFKLALGLDDLPGDSPLRELRDLLDRVMRTELVLKEAKA